MKPALIVLFVMGLSLAGCQQKPAEQPAQGQQGGGPPPMQGDPSKNPDVSGFAKEVDADGNGQMSRAEWQAKGLPSSSFDGFEKERGYVTLEDYQKNAAPPGIDGDGDGKLTVAEFIAFDKKMAAQMKDGKGPPPPPKP